MEKRRLVLRIPEQVREKLNIAAAYEDKDVFDFILDAAVDKAEEMIKNRDIIKMSQKTAEWFFNLIDNPPNPSQRLIKAFQRKKELENKI